MSDSHSTFHDALRRVTEGEVLTRSEAASAIGDIVDGRVGEIETAALLSAWKTRGETAEEIAGVVTAIRERMAPVVARVDRPVDTCGTGGDGSGTFNVSTAAAFVAAGAGVPVAKHGNRSVSSRSGSADVLAALGVSLEVPVARLGAILEEVGIVFLFAPNHHPAMAKVAAVRRSLRLRTIFNVVGPLSNPAGVKRQVVGVYRRELLPIVAGALAELGSEHALVVHGEAAGCALDEISISGKTDLIEIRGGRTDRRTLTPPELGFDVAGFEGLAGGDATENAEAIRRVLAGESGASRDVVLANAGAAIYVGGRAESLREGIARAKESIDSGRARASLDRLVEVTTALAGGDR